MGRKKKRSKAKSNMLPSAPRNNVTDRWTTDPEKASNLSFASVGHRFINDSDGADLISGKPCKVLPFAFSLTPVGYRVSRIFRLRHPFKIVGSVVGGIAVFVIDRVVGRWTRTDKGLGDEVMDKTPDAILSVVAFRSAERNTPISPYRFTVEHTTASGASTTSDPSDKTVVTNFIQTLPTDNWTPTFRFHIGGA